jgi:hypothetical protein
MLCSERSCCTRIVFLFCAPHQYRDLFARVHSILFVGDSLQRQAFISLACMLASGVGGTDPKTGEAYAPERPSHYLYSVNSRYARFFASGDR